MNINDAFPSAYIKASDLQGKDANVVIAKCLTESVGPSKDQRPVVYFEGKEKGLVLNVTNGNTIAAAYGPETDNWTGKPIQLFPTVTDFQGKQVDCIRLRVVGGNKATVPAAQPAPAGEPECDPGNPDNIPF